MHGILSQQVQGLKLRGQYGGGARSRRSQRKSRCCTVCSLRVAVVAAVAVTLLLRHWHQVTCGFFVHLCSPISLWRLGALALNLDRMPAAPAGGDPNRVLGGLGGGSTCTPLARRPGDAVRWAVLLASPKSGSTFVQQTLDGHPAVYFGTERLLDFYRDCRVNPAGHCGWPATRAVLEEVFVGYMNDPHVYTTQQVVGFK